MGNILQEGNTGVALGDIIISGMFFADDLVLVAENEQNTEIALDFTNKVTYEKGMELSCKKCNIMRFGPGATQEECKLENNRGTILESKVYKYLGILIGSSRTYTQQRSYTKKENTRFIRCSKSKVLGDTK